MGSASERTTRTVVDFGSGEAQSTVTARWDVQKPLAIVPDCVAGLAIVRDSGDSSLDMTANGGKTLPDGTTDDEAVFDEHGVVGGSGYLSQLRRQRSRLALHLRASARGPLRLCVPSRPEP